MFCDQCGKQIKQGIKFCPYCGAKVRDVEPQAPVQQTPENELRKPQPLAQQTTENEPRKPQAPLQQTTKIEPRKPQAQKTEPAKKKKPILPIICVLLVLLLLGGGGFYIYQSGLLEDVMDLIGTVTSEKDGLEAEKEPEEEQEEPEEPEEAPKEKEEEPERPAHEEKPASEEPAAETPAWEMEIPEVQQEILVSCSGSSALLTLNEWQDGQFVEVMSAQAQIGANGISDQKKEGDRCTPAGTYDVLFCFSDHAIDTGLPCYQVQSGDVWVCDPDSAYYNTLQNTSNPRKDWNASENMYDKFAKDRSRACICFAFNGDGQTMGSATPNGGSALFLDGVGSAGNMNSGYGDIKISAADMDLLLQYLDVEKHPVITIS